MDSLDEAVFSDMFVDEERTEKPTEMLCTRLKERKVPRLPVEASLARFRLAEREERRGRGRGRASMLHARKPRLDDHKPGLQQASGADRFHTDTGGRVPGTGNDQWLQENFPKLTPDSGDSDRGQGSRKGEAVRDSATDTCGSDKLAGSDTGSAPGSLTNTGQTTAARPKTRGMDRYTFAAQHLDVLKDFPSLSDSSMLKSRQVLSLTRNNLERHAKDMDSMQSSRIKLFIQTTGDSSQDAINGHEPKKMYERYSVSLDDIDVFKHQQSRVPQAVKGRVAGLLNAASPEEDCDNIAQAKGENRQGHVQVPDRGDPASDGGRLSGNEEVCHSGRSEGDLDSIVSNFTDTEGDPEDFNMSEDSEPIQSACFKEISNNDFEISEGNPELAVPTCLFDEAAIDDSVALNEGAILDDTADIDKDQQKDVYESEKKCESLEVTAVVSSNGLEYTGTEINKELEGSISRLDEITINDDTVASIVIPEVSSNGFDYTEIEMKKELEGSISQLDDTAINDDIIASNKSAVGSGPASSKNNTEDEDLPVEEERGEDFVVVKYKHKKKDKSESTGRKSHKGGSTASTIWRLYGPFVMQVSGLPAYCDISVLREMVNGFGMIKEEQVRQIDNGCSVRFKFSKEDDCEYAVQTLHDTESLFPDAECALQCERLKH